MRALRPVAVTASSVMSDGSSAASSFADLK
jgi:hypothetical protein